MEQLRLLTTEAEARCVPRLHVTHKQERNESKLLHAGASTLPGALRHSSGANIHQPEEGPNGLKIFVFLKGTQIADRVGGCSASGGSPGSDVGVRSRSDRNESRRECVRDFSELVSWDDTLLNVAAIGLLLGFPQSHLHLEHLCLMVWHGHVATRTDVPEVLAIHDLLSDERHAINAVVLATSACLGCEVYLPKYSKHVWLEGSHVCGVFNSSIGKLADESIHHGKGVGAVGVHAEGTRGIST